MPPRGFPIANARRLTLLHRFALLALGALAVSSALTLAFAGGWLANITRDQAIERARGVARVVAAAAQALPPAALPALLDSARRGPGIAYVEVVTDTGALVWQSSAWKRPAPRDSALRRERERVIEDLVEGVAVVDVPASGPAGQTAHVGLDAAELDRGVRNLRLSLFALQALAILLCGAGAIVSARQALGPLRRLSHSARRVVEGDLARPLEAFTNDEVGDLAGSFRQMVEKLVEVLGALQESAELLTEAGDKLSTSTQEQGHTITRQATALQETQVTAQEIKQTSLLAAQKADAVLKLTEKADEVSTSGEEAIERSLGGLTDIRAQVEDISQRIAQLSERTQQIGSITATVKDLADQSNMLALNAAIEAVRSGEHGKGFAVVAREIRSLADQSIQATNRVREILEDIGSAIRGAVAITERGAQKIEGGLLQVKASGDNLRELSNIVKDNSSAVRQIAAAVSQQNAGITQIFSAVTDQTKMMDETMRRLETTTQAASVLKDLAVRVTAVVKRFRV